MVIGSLASQPSIPQTARCTCSSSRPTTPFAPRAAGRHSSTRTRRTSVPCMSTPVRATAQTDRYGSRTSAGPECESSAWSSGSGSMHEVVVGVAERLGKRYAADLAPSGRPAKPCCRDRRSYRQMGLFPCAGSTVQAISSDPGPKPTVIDLDLDIPEQHVAHKAEGVFDRWLRLAVPEVKVVVPAITDDHRCRLHGE